MSDETTSPEHLQTIQNSFCQRMSRTYEDMTTSIKSRYAAAFSEFSAEPTPHQALAPSSPIWPSNKLIMLVMDALIFSASAKAWRQRLIKAGV